MMSKKIIFITVAEINDFNTPGIYTDLIRQFRKNGNEIYIVSPVEKKSGKKTKYRKTKEGIYHLKVRTGNITQINLVTKALSLMKINSQYKRAIKKYIGNVKFDLVLYTTPPITLNGVIKSIKKQNNSISYLLLKDIFPQNAIDLKMIKKNGLIHKYYSRKEKELYKISDFIGCMSKRNMDFIGKNANVDLNKIEVNPNSAEIRDNYPFSTEEVVKLRNKHKIPINKRVFIYGGNLGRPQGVDFIISCIKANELNDNSFYVLVGSGAEFFKLKNYFDEAIPKNAILLDKVSRKDYDELVKICDFGLIFLDYRFTIPNIPSRLINYLECAKPVFAITDRNTDLKEIIEDNQIGFWEESKDVNQINDYIKRISELEKNEYDKLCTNARIYLERELDVKDTYEKIIQKISGGTKNV